MATTTVNGITLGYEIKTDEATGKKCAVITGKPSPSPTGSLIIPEKLGGCPVTAIGDRAFIGCEGLATVTIPEGVTTIGQSAFLKCVGLTKVTIPASVTMIGEGVFGGCGQIKSIEVAPENQAYVVEGEFLLTKDRKTLVSAVCPKGDVVIPVGVERIGVRAFQGRPRLISVTIPDGVTTIDDFAFGFCEHLTTVTIPASVTTLGCSVFRCCERITEVRLPHGVTAIGEYAFNPSVIRYMPSSSRLDEHCALKQSGKATLAEKKATESKEKKKCQKTRQKVYTVIFTWAECERRELSVYNFSTRGKAFEFFKRYLGDDELDCLDEVLADKDVKGGLKGLFDDLLASGSGYCVRGDYLFVRGEEIG